MFGLVQKFFDELKKKTEYFSFRKPIANSYFGMGLFNKKFLENFMYLLSLDFSYYFVLHCKLGVILATLVYIKIDFFLFFK